MSDQTPTTEAERAKERKAGKHERIAKLLVAHGVKVARSNDGWRNGVELLTSLGLDPFQQ